MSRGLRIGGRGSVFRTGYMLLAFLAGAFLGAGAHAGVDDVLLGVAGGDMEIDPGAVTPGTFGTLFSTAEPPEPALVLGPGATYLQIGAMWTGGPGGEVFREIRLVTDSDGDGRLDPFDPNSPEHPWNRPDNGTPDDPSDDPLSWEITIPEDYPEAQLRGRTLPLSWDPATESVVGFPEDAFDWEWYQSRWDSTRTGVVGRDMLITDIWLPMDDAFQLYPNGDYPIGVWVDENGDGTYGPAEAHRSLVIRIRSALLTGRVVDAEGAPIEGASVDAFSAAAFGSGTTGADGGFAVTGLKDGEAYMVQVSASGKSTVIRMDVEIPAGEGRADMGTIRMRDAVAITGVLKLDRNANGITDEPADAFQPFVDQWGVEREELMISVDAVNEDGVGWGSAEVLFTPGETSKDFSIDVPPAEAARYRVSAGVGPYATRSALVMISTEGGEAGTLVLTRAATLAGTVKLPVAVDQWTEINVLAVNVNDPRDRYWGWGEIDPYYTPGRCRDPQYPDRESCEAAEETWNDETWSETPTPMDTGVFRIEGIPAGTYHVGIEVSGFKRRRITDVAVAQGEDRDVGEIALERGGTISGTLTILGETTGLIDEAFPEGGDLLVWVDVWSPGSGETAGTEVRVPRGLDQGAPYVIGGLDDGRYEMDAWLADGYELVDAAGDAPVLVNLSGAAERDLFLKPFEGIIQGMITAAGVAVDPARVVVEARRPWDWNDPVRATVKNGGIDPETGAYRITGLGTDDYVVRAGMFTVPSGADDPDSRFPDPAVGIITQRVQVVNDAQRPSRVDIELQPGYSVSGRIRLDPADPPWEDVGDGGGGPPNAVRDADESITIADDLAGEFVRAIPMDTVFQAGIDAGDALLGRIVDNGDGTAGYRIDGLSQGAYLIVPPLASQRILDKTPVDYGDFADLFDLFGGTATRHWTVDPRLVVIHEDSPADEDFLLSNGHTVSGTITLPESQTISDGENDLWSWVGHLSLQTPEEILPGHQRILLKRDFNGTDTVDFSFTHVADGDYQAYFWTDLYVAESVRVTVAGADAAADLAVSAGVDLVGRLVDAETGEAVTAEDGVRVICESVPFVEGSYRETSAESWSRSYIEDGSDLQGGGPGADDGRENGTPGQFHLTAVESGLEYIIVVESDHGRRERGGKNYVGRVIAGIEVPAGATGEIDVGTLDLTEGITLAGRLTDTDGDPVAGVTVAAAPSDEHDGVAETTAVSDRTGNYVLFGIDPEVEGYDLMAAPRPWLFEDWGKQVEWGEERRYNIDPATIDPETGRTAGADITLRRPTASLEGRITIPGGARFMLPFLADVGESFPGAYILLQRKGVVYRDMLEGIEGITRPRPKGARTATYRIENIQPGTYRVAFMNYGLPRAVIDNVVFAEGEHKVINASWDNDFFRISGTLSLDGGGEPSTSDISGVLCLNLADRSVVFGRLAKEADDTYSAYEVAGLAGSDTYQLIFFSDAGIDDTPAVFAAGEPFTPGYADVPLDVAIARDPEPILILRALRDPETPDRFRLAIFTTDYLSDEAVSVAETEPAGDADGARLFLRSGGGSLSEVALSADRRRITAIYDGTGAGTVELVLAVHYGTEAQSKVVDFTFDAGARGLNSDVVIPYIDEQFALGGGDPTRVHIPAGTFETEGGRNAVVAIERASSDGSAPGLPAGISPAGDRYTITATDPETGDPPAFKGPLTVQLRYDPAAAPETGNLHVYQRSGDTWVRKTDNRVLDPENATLAVEVAGLSDFVVGYGEIPEAPETGTRPVVISGGGESSDCFIGAAEHSGRPVRRLLLVLPPILMAVLLCGRAETERRPP